MLRIVCADLGLLSKAEVHGMCGEDAPVLRGSNGRVVNPFRFLSLGIMAYLGNERAGTSVIRMRSETILTGCTRVSFGVMVCGK